MKTLQKLTIKRSEWFCPLTNKEAKGSCLLNKNGKKCCLGFACIDLGIPADKLMSKGMPEHVIKEESQFTKISIETITGIRITIDSELSEKAANINDDWELEPSEREEMLITLFRQNSIEVTFID